MAQRCRRGAVTSSEPLASVELTPGTLAGYDAVLVLTDHSDVDYDMLRQHARLIIDARGRYSGVTDPKIIPA